MNKKSSLFIVLLLLVTSASAMEEKHTINKDLAELSRELSDILMMPVKLEKNGNQNNYRGSLCHLPINASQEDNNWLIRPFNKNYAFLVNIAAGKYKYLRGISFSHQHVDAVQNITPSLFKAIGEGNLQHFKQSIDSGSPMYQNLTTNSNPPKG